ncbi:MAG: YraN family protein [SAR324 cluster bacterium]|jgi:putative endonuclease|nr:YraN family protein [SAR324 cluster bacterium]
MEAATDAIGFAVTKARQSLGASGEQAADEHLAQQGLIVLERNFRCRLGEIDIIARDGEQLVFCEVKTRREGGPHPFLSVTQRKQRKLRQLGLYYLSGHHLEHLQPRFDVIAVHQAQDGSFTIEHLPNAF